MDTENVEKEDLKSGNKKWSVKRVAIVAVFIALSAVGAMIKIPSPIGSIGLDSCPGYFVAVAFGGVEGALVIAIGHLLSAAVVGFPLTIPIHLGVAASMALWAFTIRFFSKKGHFGLWIGVVVATLLNTFATGLFFLPIGGWAMYITTVPSLIVASAVNTILAAVAFQAVKGSKLLSK